MAFLHKEKGDQEQYQDPAPQGTDPITTLRQQGYTDDQIVQTLLQQGYTQQQVNDLFAQQQAPQEDQQQYQQEYAATGDDQQIQEIVETIINEKWTELSKDIKSITEWKDKIDTKNVQLQQQVDDIKAEIQSLKNAILGKISDYDKNILNVGTEIKAMEKVFQKVLPSLTDSVNKLERMSKRSSKK
tara:strand:+ start:20 stop:577 length:558 start_codon:yes stop_codon:yes gene_type:complete